MAASKRQAVKKKRGRGFARPQQPASDAGRKGGTAVHVNGRRKHPKKKH